METYDPKQARIDQLQRDLAAMTTCAYAKEHARSQLERQAQQPLVVPAGWKLVPVELVEEMRVACRVMDYQEDIDAEWARLLAAAPTPPSVTQSTETVAAGVGALILAEIERLDRAAIKTNKEQDNEFR